MVIVWEMQPMQDIWDSPTYPNCWGLAVHCPCIKMPLETNLLCKLVLIIAFSQQFHNATAELWTEMF